MLVSEIGQVASISNLLLTRKFIHFGKIFTLSLALRGLLRAPGAKQLTSAAVISLSCLSIAMITGGQIESSRFDMTDIVFDKKNVCFLLHI